MIKTKTKTYTKKVTEEVDEALICDHCKKKINYKERYLNVTSSHNDWGNDSCDSFQSSDIHEKCLQNYLRWLFTNRPILCSLKDKRNWNIEIETEWNNINEVEDE